MWNAGWIVVILLGAAAGGFACSKVAADQARPVGPDRRVGVGGALSALFYVPAGEGMRPADVGMFDAMGSARSPMWLVWATLPLDALGAFFGGRIAGRG